MRHAVEPDSYSKVVLISTGSASSPNGQNLALPRSAASLVLDPRDGPQTSARALVITRLESHEYGLVCYDNDEKCDQVPIQ